MKCGWTPWDGSALTGWPVRTWCGGVPRSSAPRAGASARCATTCAAPSASSTRRSGATGPPRMAWGPRGEHMNTFGRAFRVTTWGESLRGWARRGRRRLPGGPAAQRRRPAAAAAGSQAPGAVRPHYPASRARPGPHPLRCLRRRDDRDAHRARVLEPRRRLVEVRRPQEALSPLARGLHLRGEVRRA